MIRLLEKFFGNNSGATAVIFGITLPVLILMSGFAIEFGGLVVQKSRLQSVADFSALAAAKEMSLSDNDDDRVRAVVTALVKAAVVDKKGGKGQPVTISVNVDRNNNKVQVTLSQIAGKYFPVKGFEVKQVAVTAEATVIGTLRACVIALDNSASNTVGLDSNAILTAKNCAVFSNSTHSQSIQSNSNAVLTASLICSAGGASGGTSNLQPEALTDCPVFEDPLSDRPEPVVGACSHTDLVIIDETRKLTPGTYCGGLRLDGNAIVTLNPGIYIIKDGPFVVDSNAQVTGDYVGLYFTGDMSTFTFDSNAKINLSAPKDGILAGILMFEDRSATPNRKFTIYSNFARNLLGTIYLSRGHLDIDADNPIADQSAYTALVVRQLHLTSGPNLVLNANYDDTDVPVPAKIKGLSSNVTLSK